MADSETEEQNRAFESVLSLMVDQFPRETEGQPMWKDWELCGRYLPHVMYLCGQYKEHYPDTHKSAKLASLISACSW
jgi:hypothetical protein